MADEHPPTVLIVDDEPDARNSLEMLLSLTGYRSVSAGNGQEALDYLRSNPPPCLILLDLFMPVMDGVAFLRERRQDPALAAIPVLVQSGEAKSEQAASENGAEGYFQKPADPRQVLHVISRYCGRSRGYR